MATIKLHLINEVQCKFVGLPPKVRSDMIKTVTYKDWSAQWTPAVRLGHWDGNVSFMNMGGKTYIHLLDKLLPVVEKHGYSVEIVDERLDPVDWDLGQIDDRYLADVEFPRGHHMEGKEIILRPHQVESVNTLLANRHGIMEAATGAGKTLICAALGRKVQAFGRSIVIVPSKDLVTQTEEDYKLCGLDVGVFFGDRKEYDKMHTICTWQSLHALWKKSKKKARGEIDMDEQTIDEFLDGVCCVIVDECLSGDTLIRTPAGEVPIKDIGAGDKVYSYNEETQEFVVDTVVKRHENLMKSNSAEMLEIEMEDGSVLKITDNHKVFTQRGWIEAGQLTLDDEILNFEDRII